MEDIYIYTEGISDEINNYIEANDDDSHHIHIYEDIVTSSQGNMYFALAEVFLNLMEHFNVNSYDVKLNKINAEDKVTVITDIPMLYDQLLLLYGDSEFSMINLCEMGKNPTSFFPSYNIEELITYELSVVRGHLMAHALLRLWQIRDDSNLINWTNVSEDIRHSRNEKHYFGDAITLHFLNLIMADVEANDYEYAYSFLHSLKMQITRSSDDLIKYLIGLDKYTKLSPINGYFIWNQLQYFADNNMITNDDESRRLQNNLYTNCYNAFAEASNDFTVPILEKKRNPNRVMIVTTQFLTESHYPTDMAKGLVLALNSLGYELFIFNTIERYTPKGYVPMYAAVGGNVIKNFEGIDKIDCYGTEIPYYQPSAVSSYLDIVNKAINKAYEFNPLYILVLGNGSIIGDLLDRMIPTATLDITKTTLPTTKSRIRILTRPFERNEKIPKLFTDGYTVIAPNFKYQVQDVEDAKQITFELDRQIRHTIKDANPLI